MRALIERNVLDTLRSFSPQTKKRVKAALAALADNPEPPGRGGTIKRLDVPGSGETVLRVRVGDHRAVYVVRGQEIRILRVFHREEGYDWLRRLRLD